MSPLPTLTLSAPPSLRSGVPPDPSAVIARQLGLKLVILGEELPIYDAVTGKKVPEEVDSYVERVREEVMDKAVEVTKEKSHYDDDILAMSFGVEVERALAEREKAAAVRQTQRGTGPFPAHCMQGE